MSSQYDETSIKFQRVYLETVLGASFPCALTTLPACFWFLNICQQHLEHHFLRSILSRFSREVGPLQLVDPKKCQYNLRIWGGEEGHPVSNESDWITRNVCGERNLIVSFKRNHVTI